MRFPPELEAKVLRELREHPDNHMVFPDRAYDRQGAIVVNRDNLQRRLHRYLWDTVHPDAPIGRRFLIRQCRRQGCVNPHHHKPSATTRRLAEQCPNGHDYPPNTPRVGSKQVRRCPACYQRRLAARRTTQRRRGYCKEGHRLTSANSYQWTDRQGRQHRRCRRCTILAARRRRATLKEKNGATHG